MPVFCAPPPAPAAPPEPRPPAPPVAPAPVAPAPPPFPISDPVACAAAAAELTALLPLLAIVPALLTVPVQKIRKLAVFSVTPVLTVRLESIASRVIVYTLLALDAQVTVAVPSRVAVVSDPSPN